MSDNLPQQRSADSAGRIGIMLVGHGTRNLAGQGEFRSLFSQFEQLVEPVPAELAFLELAEPNIATAARALHLRGVTQVLVVPVILFTAGHAEQDIPYAVHEAISPLGITSVGQTAALECSAEVLDLSAIRFREAACPAACAAGCSGQICSSAALVLVGRGSSSAEATEKAREFSKLRWRLTPTLGMQCAFIHGQEPTVEMAMNDCEKQQVTTVVIQPHLLFSGLLMDELREQVKHRQERNQDQRWIIAETLGADRKLAEVFAQRAKDALRSLS